MKKTLIFLSMSSVINYNKADVCRGERRLDQYVVGLKQFFIFIKKYESQCDIMLFDNTVAKDSKLSDKILSIIPANVVILHELVNKFGAQNKGAGIIEQWSYCKTQMEQYQWIIHFEPRQLLMSGYFFESFFATPRVLFKHYIVKGRHYFWTGLFAVEKDKLSEFCTKYPPKYLAERHICLENIMYDHLFENYNHIDSLDLVWYDYYANAEKRQ